VEHLHRRPDDREHPGCVWLLRWTAKPKHAGEKIAAAATPATPGTATSASTNNPLPKWWLWLFYITVVFGLLYLLAYPARPLGRLPRLVAGGPVRARAAAGGGPGGRVARALRLHVRASARGQPTGDGHGAQPVPEQLRAVPRLRRRGARGFPNLANDDWQWGGDPDSIVQTIAGGRTAAMTPWGEVLGPRASSRSWPTCGSCRASRPMPRRRPPGRRTSRPTAWPATAWTARA